MLTPGSTDYRKRIQYQVYDVTDLLRGGENAMTVELADGWYRGSNGGAGQTNTFGTQTKLLAQLELTLADGTTQTVCSDGSWAWSNDGPIRFADLKDGEIVDANREPSYSGSVRVVEEHAPLTASDNVPVLERERFCPGRTDHNAVRQDCPQICAESFGLCVLPCDGTQGPASPHHDGRNAR